MGCGGAPIAPCRPPCREASPGGRGVETGNGEATWHRVVAMITSAANAGWECDITVTNSETGLTAPSVIRPWKLATVDISRVVRIAGRISKDDAAKLSRTLTETISS